MDELVMNEDTTVNEFLDLMLATKDHLARDIVGNINGLSVSTEGCTTRLQLQNKVANVLYDYINEKRNETPTKRQQDEMTIMLDESIVPKADWDDPNDVLAWIEESTKNLNDPEFARTVYEDGKTPSEVMVEMLKSHGYGEMHENQSEAERKINAKISDLENYGFLMADFFDDETITISQPKSMNEQPPETAMETFTGEVEPISFGGEETQEEDDRFLSQNASEFEDDDYDYETNEDSFQPPITAQPDPSMLFKANQDELESEVIRRQLEAVERKDSINTMEQSSKLAQDDIETDFFTTRPKDGENESIEKSEEFLQPKAKDTDTVEDEFFKTKPKDADTIENEFFKTKPKDNSLENEQEDNDFLQVKPKDEDIAELKAFQAKYGPTANVKEMKIVKRLEKELVELKDRRTVIKDELSGIHEKLKSPSQVVSNGVQIANIENKSNSDLAIQAVKEKARLSTTEVRNSQAILDFYRAAEEHNVFDIVRASNSTRALGNDHIFTNVLTDALNEIAKTYYGKTPDELQTELIASTKKLNETRSLLTLLINQSVTNEYLEPVKKSFEEISNDHAKEKIFSTMIEIQNLGENYHHREEFLETLDQISNVYYGKSAEEIKNQILNSSKACNEAQEEIQRLRLREKENSLVLTKPELDAQYASEALQRAIMNHSKENILEAATLAQRLDSKEPSRAAINKALNQLAVTHLNKNLTELRWEDARTAIEEAQKGTNTNDQEAMQRFNQATKTYTKADIIVALNMAKEAKCNELVSALNKMAIAYYGVDAEALTSQFRNYSKALSEVQNLISSNEILQDAKENEAMPLFHKAVQSKSEEDIMNALDAANHLPSYHPLRKPILVALNAQLILVTREEPMIFEEPVAVNDNKKELQKKATALLQEYQKVDSDIKKRQSDLSQYAKNKQKEKEKLEEPPARVIDETTNKNPNLFKKACAGAKEVLKQMKLKKVATTIVKAAALGTAATFAPIPLALGYFGYNLLRNPEKAKEEKEEKKQARQERIRKIRDALTLEDEESLEQEEPVQQSSPVEQQMAAPSQEEIEFYKAEENEWVKLNSPEELIHEAIEGSIIGASINQGPIQEYSNEEVMNYLHNGTLELSEEENEAQYDDVEVRRGK